MSQLTTIGRDQIHFNFHSANSRHLELAVLNPVKNNSYVEHCMPGTRQWILDRIYTWLDDPLMPNVLWLGGSPGAGKSTMAWTVVSRLRKLGRFGSSFFCKRHDVSLSDPAAIWRSIAFELAQCDPVIANKIIENLTERRVDPGSVDIASHFEYLIDDPLMESWKHRVEALGSGMRADNEGRGSTADEILVKDSPVVVIDALDECGSDISRSSQRQNLINTITMWSRLPPSLKLIVTSRDDRIPKSLRDISHRVTLETGDAANPEAMNDIRTFFTGRFAAIAAQNSSLSPTWPGGPIIKELTDRAAGLFIWADTVIKFLERGIPSMRLDVILNGRFRHGERALDQLYSQVIGLTYSQFTDDELEICKLVVGVVVLAKIPLHRQDLRYFLGRCTDESSITSVLQILSSVISSESAGRVYINHLSFTEFICDPDRCGERYAVDRSSIHRVMLLASLHCMRKELRFNICGLETSHVRNSDITDLTSRVEKFIPTCLSYSCRFWADHLASTTYHTEIFSELRYFMHNQFLSWLEVMSLTKQNHSASGMLLSLIDWIRIYRQDDTMATDMRKFVVAFASVISQSTTHIYLSALPFAPRNSAVSKQYLHQYPRTLTIEAGGQSDWPTFQNVFSGHTGAVISVAFSPDSKYIVSASFDKTIRVWHAETGEIILGPLEVLDGMTRCAAFSVDGKLIVSGSSDGTIAVWDVETGEVIAGPFQQNIQWLYSVAFSHDSKQIILESPEQSWVLDVDTGEVLEGPPKRSIYQDRVINFSPNGKRFVPESSDTICVYDSKTKEVVAGPFKHPSWVTSFAFSPDSKRIVSGCYDNMIRVWDAETNEIIPEPFEYNDWVSAIACSPDGKRIVSGSDKGTIRVWNAETGDVIIRPFKGHTSWVTSFAFSPNGRWIVSGSSDLTICVWGSETGKIIAGPFKGHTQSVTCIACSPDSKLIVSGSGDKTIRVWNAMDDQLVLRLLEGHSSCINAITFSSDGKNIISGSDDQTIRVWDAESGKVIARPFKGHSSYVKCIALSPDGKRIISGSYGTTIRVWDAETGKVIMGPFIGHTYGVTCVACSPDGQLIVSGSWDMTIIVWDAVTGKIVVGPFRGHTGPVISVSFSSDGKQIVSGSLDDTIRVWNIGIDQRLAGPPENKKVNSSNSAIALHYTPKHLGQGLYSFTSSSKIKDGWVLGSNSELLFWIPPNIHDGLWRPSNNAVMGRLINTTRLNLESFVHGDDWSQCKR